MSNETAIKYIEPRMNNGKYSNEQLVARIRAGENEAECMLSLWQQNQGFIHKMAVRYSGFAEIEDLKQEAYIGLCAAVEHYDEDKGVPFVMPGFGLSRSCSGILTTAAVWFVSR